jgi:hypothetical protein
MSDRLNLGRNRLACKMVRELIAHTSGTALPVAATRLLSLRAA